MKDYWSALTELGLLEYEVTTQTFKTIEEGLRCLEAFSELDQRAREEEQQRNNNDNNSSLNAYGSKRIIIQVQLL
ncbi:MAG: hypothetical protein M3M87_02180 [Thermoproteota archaeon]|nr:hypothetical protein [Thermoproteota archaeon]